MRKELLYDFRELHQLQEQDEALQKFREKGSRNLHLLVDNGVVYCKSAREEHWKLALPKMLLQPVIFSTNSCVTLEIIGYISICVIISTGGVCENTPRNLRVLVIFASEKNILITSWKGHMHF